MFPSCNECGFDWKNDELGFELLLGGDLSANLNMVCPVCGTEATNNTLAQLGAVRGPSNRVFVWASGARTRRHIRIEGEKLITTASSREVEAEANEERAPTPVFFDKVAVFADEASQPRLPDLPIKPEFLHLIDWEAYDFAPPHGPPRIEGWRGRVTDDGRYEATVPLKGAHEPAIVVRSITGDARPISNLELTVWPNLPVNTWQRHLLEARWVEGKPGAWRLSDASVIGSGFEVREFTKADFSAALAAGGQNFAQRLAATLDGGHPVGVSLRVASGNQEAGGAFRIWPVAAVQAERGQKGTLGIDFGTSNSCAAISTDGAAGQPHIRSITNLYRVVIQSSEVRHLEIRLPRMPTQGFGGTSYLLPSQLNLLVGTKTARTEDGADFLRGGVLGLHYALMGATSAPSAAQTQFLLGDLKWPDQNQGQQAFFQTLYLEGLIVQAVASEISERVAANSPIPPRLEVRFACPGSWDAADRLRLTGAVQAACTRAQLWFSTELHLQETPISEAHAALNVVGSDTYPLRGMQRVGGVAHWEASLLVDVGGGSSDVSLVWKPHGDDPKVEYQSSLRHAGEDLMRGLLAGQTDPHQLQFGVRTGARNLFQHPDQKKRTVTFYNHLTEYCAVWLAALIRAGVVDIGPNVRFQLNLVPLGNGWGHLSYVSPRAPETNFAQKLRRRVSDLLSRDVDVGVAVLDGGIERKHVVALGVLELGNHQLSYAFGDDYVDEPAWISRSPLGLGVGSYDAGVPYEWWLPVEAGSENLYHPSDSGPQRAPVATDLKLEKRDIATGGAFSGRCSVLDEYRLEDLVGAAGGLLGRIMEDHNGQLVRDRFGRSLLDELMNTILRARVSGDR